MLHECLTGRHPFAKLGKPPTVSSILAGDPVIPRELRPEIPADLERLCLACLSYKPENRPNAQEVYQALQNILIDRPIQLVSGRAQDHVINRIEEHVSTIEKWQQLGMVENRDRDQLRWFYRKILEGDDMWPTETRKIQPGEIGLYACVWIAVVVSYLCGVYYRVDMGLTWSWLLPLGITFSLASAAWVVEGTIQHRIRPLFFGGAILASIPRMIAMLTRFAWVPDENSTRELFGFAWDRQPHSFSFRIDRARYFCDAPESHTILILRMAFCGTSHLHPHVCSARYWDSSNGHRETRLWEF